MSSRMRNHPASSETRRSGRFELAVWLVRHTRALVALLGVAVLARVAGQTLGVALLVVAATAIAAAAAGESVSVPAMIAVLVMLSLAKAGLRYLEHYTGHWVAFTALARLRELFFARLIPQAPATTQGRAGAELTERATRDIDRIEVFFAHTLPPAISAVTTPVIVLSWLAAATQPAFSAALAPFVGAVVILVPLVAGRRTWRYTRDAATRRGEQAARLGDDVQGVREILGFGIRQARLDGLDRADRVLAAAQLRLAGIQAGRTAAIAALQSACLIAVVAVGASLVADTTATTADVVTALAVVVGLWSPSRGVDTFVAGLDAAFAATNRLRQVVDAPPRVRDPQRPEEAVDAWVSPAGPADVELDAVTFAYPGRPTSHPTLDRVTAYFRPGAWTYIVGVSGSGKSTLASLLLRAWDPDEGSVRLRGTDVRRSPLDRLRQAIALVPQRPTMLTATIADNLRLGAPDADDTTLWEAVAVAGIDTWVASLPHGLDTAIRERGRNVSGGQRQRLALARALVAAPDVLILDEALSQLDAATARLVRDRLAVHRADLTIIEITHRADLIPDDGQTIVMDAGRVIEQATARDLRAADGAFVRLESRAR